MWLLGHIGAAQSSAVQGKFAPFLTSAFLEDFGTGRVLPKF